MPNSTFATPAIPTLDLVDHVRQFAAEPALVPLLQAGSRQLAVVEVERLYPLYQQAVPPTRATGHSLIYIASGQAHIAIGSKPHVVGPGEVMLTRAGQLFSFEPGDVTTGIVCHFQESFLLEPAGSADTQAAFALLHGWGRPVVSLPPAAAVFVEQLFRRLLAEYTAHQVAYPALVRAYLLALLHELNRAYATQPEPTRLPTAVRLTTAFKQLVTKNLRSTHRVGDYAEQLHVSTNHLSKCVRRITGQSPTRWIEECVVREAQALLFQSQQPVSEVAAAVGIGDNSYFSRLFKKHTGQTPLAFRKEQQRS